MSVLDSTVFRWASALSNRTVLMVVVVVVVVVVMMEAAVEGGERFLYHANTAATVTKTRLQRLQPAEPVR